jgi:hypothetical protein
MRVLSLYAGMMQVKLTLFLYKCWIMNIFSFRIFYQLAWCERVHNYFSKDKRPLFFKNMYRINDQSVKMYLLFKYVERRLP